MERDPNKRKIKPPTQNYLDFEDLEESSDDSDFRIEDHKEEDSDDDTINSDDSGSGDGGEDEENSDSDESVKKSIPGGGSITSVNLLSTDQLKDQLDDISKYSKVLVCCVCLGERSDDVNEIVECDSCGVTVHEGCYGVQDTASNSSTASSCSTEPWFCESCRAGIAEPTCELCPNFGGIFKETDVGKWVHLVCALYIPGVAFGEVDRLSNVTLFEMPYSRWGAKACALCSDIKYCRTGVAIQCDAGMCRTYFHVTCAQKEGLLSEATSEEVDQADPFYAHCKLHSDKVLIKKRKKNFLSMQTRVKIIKKQRELEILNNEKVYQRIQRKLGKYKIKYVEHKSFRNPAWIPAQKLARPVTSSATLCRALSNKAKLMQINSSDLEQAEIDITAIREVNKKWHIPLAFNIEFVAYFLNRHERLKKLQKEQTSLVSENEYLQNQQSSLQKSLDELSTQLEDRAKDCNKIRSTLELYHNVMLQACPNKKLPSVDSIGKSNLHVTSNHHPLAVRGGVPTAAALKAGVGFPIRNLIRTTSSSSMPSSTVTTTVSSSSLGTVTSVLSHKCGLCHLNNDQHLMAKCDTCHLYYHLGCLTPPLTRMPKKTKLMGWQCSECDKESSDSNPENIDTEAPRKLRHGRDNSFLDDSAGQDDVGSQPVVKKTKWDKIYYDRDRYSPEPAGKSQVRTHKRKKKKNKTTSPPPISNGGEESHPRIKLLIKSIPNPNSQAPQCFIATQANSSADAPTHQPMATIPIAQKPSPSVRKEETAEDCSTCLTTGLPSAMVKCDECRKSFHFGCLDPPVKKSPKVRGYSWHCADCDPTESDSS